MGNREHLAAILSILLDDINHYLKDVKPTLFEATEREALGVWKFRHAQATAKGGVFYDEENQKYICIASNSFRNLTLLTKRVKNMLAIKTILTQQLQNLKSNENIDGNQMREIVKHIKKELQTTLEQNNVLNAQYGKHHISYYQNRLSGMVFFSSLWNRSPFQSRAMSALEKAHSHLINFEEQFVAISNALRG